MYPLKKERKIYGTIEKIAIFIGYNFSPKVEGENPLFVCCEMHAISMYPQMLIAIFEDSEHFRSYYKENISTIQGQEIYRGVKPFLQPIKLFQINIIIRT